MISFKLMILGEPGVGKSSFLNNYMGKRFRGDLPSTIGVEFEQKDIVTSDLNEIEKKLLKDYRLGRWLWKKGLAGGIENGMGWEENPAEMKKGMEIYSQYNKWVKKYLQSNNGSDYKHVWGDEKKDLLTLKIWNSAGQDKFRSIVSSYFRKTEGVIFIYDLTSPYTLESIERWIQDFEKGYGWKENESEVWMGLPAILVGNKFDLWDQDNEKMVCQKRIDEICRKYNMIDFKVSSLVNFNQEIQFCFESLAYLMMKDFLITKGLKMIYGHGEWEKLDLDPYSVYDENRRRFSCCS